jgi:hypothetical protein
LTTGQQHHRTRFVSNAHDRKQDWTDHRSGRHGARSVTGISEVKVRALISLWNHRAIAHSPERRAELLVTVFITELRRVAGLNWARGFWFGMCAGLVPTIVFIIYSLAER